MYRFAMRRLKRPFSIALPLLALWVLTPSALGWQEQAEVAGDDEVVADAAQTDSEESAASDDATHATQADDGAGHATEDPEHGDEHVDLDPTHANMTDPTYAVVDFRTDMAFFSAIVFLLLLFGLSATAWKPIMQGLEKREDTIAGNIADAEKAKVDAESKLAEYESKLAAANEEAAAIVAEARKDAEATGQKVVAEAQEEAQRLRERATADIESAKRVALADLANQSTDVAMALAQRVVGREVRAEDHQGLIQEMLAKLPSKN